MIFNKLFYGVLRENRKLKSINFALKSDFDSVLRETSKSKVSKDDKATCDDVMDVLHDMRFDNIIQRVEDRKSDDLIPPEIGDIISKVWG
jgi:hypothetical protein